MPSAPANESVLAYARLGTRRLSKFALLAMAVSLLSGMLDLVVYDSIGPLEPPYQWHVSLLFCLPFAAGLILNLIAGIRILRTRTLHGLIMTGIGITASLAGMVLSILFFLPNLIC